MPPGTFFVTLPVPPAQRNTGAFPKYTFASYGAKTRVQMVAAGLISKTRIDRYGVPIPGVAPMWISPLGHCLNGAPYNWVKVDFRKGNLYGGGWPRQICNAPLTDTIDVDGVGTVERAAGYPYAGFGCGASYEPPCYAYAGEHSVRLRPVAKVLELVAEPSQVKSGDQVRFTARRKDGKPLTTVNLWLWKPLSPVVGANNSTTYGPTASGCNQSSPTCDVVMTNTHPPADPVTTPQRGLMYVRAVVDGVEETARAEVTVTRDLPPVIVNLPSGETTVPPVISRIFSAVSQKWNRVHGAQERRRDIVELPVSADFDTSKYDWVRVQLVASSVDGSGGHPHGAPRPNHAPRPTGSFFPTRNQAEEHQGRLPDSVTVDLTPAQMSATVIYRSSGVAGVERIEITATAKAKGSPNVIPVSSSTKSVNVRFDGLTPMAMNGTYYYFKTNATARHNGINNFADATFRGNVLAAFEDYIRYFDDTVEAPRFTGVTDDGDPETRFVITEASLEWGGLLDYKLGIGWEWSNPHKLHRAGEDMDVRERTLDKYRQRIWMLICKRHYLRCVLHPEAPEEPNHFHVSPENRRTPL